MSISQHRSRNFIYTIYSKTAILQHLFSQLFEYRSRNAPLDQMKIPIRQLGLNYQHLV